MPTKQRQTKNNLYKKDRCLVASYAIYALFSVNLVMAETATVPRWQCSAASEAGKTGWQCTEQTKAVGSNTGNLANSKPSITNEQTCSNSDFIDTKNIDTEAQTDNLTAFNFSEQSSLPIKTSAKNVSLKNGQVVFENDVVFKQGSITLNADRALLDNTNKTIALTGNINVATLSGEISGDSADINLSTDQSEIINATYRLGSQQARGNASRISTNAQQQIIIEQGSYTQCPKNNEVWKIQASSITLNTETSRGSATHARLEVYNTPIAYIPYAQFPIGDERQSGMLFPALSESGSGVDITLPYYLNLAPNWDATLSPRYKEQHGYITELETRWLNIFDLWQISGAYIGDDSSINPSNANSSSLSNVDKKRWLLNIKEKGALEGGFSSAIDYTKISDADYLRDLNTTSLSINRATHLNQQAAFYYNGNAWSGGLKFQQQQTIDPNITAQNRPYKKLPELWLQHQSSKKPFHLNTNGQARFTAFDHETLNATNRSYGKFDLNYPMVWQSVYVTPEIGAEHINYDFDNRNQTSKQTSSLSYTAAHGSMTLGTTFEKQSAKNIKTIEPTVQYRYKKITHNANDSTLAPSFDTDWLTVNKQTLLRSSRFSGYDRIEETNQLAGVLTHRIINAQGKQTLAASIGQIIYFQDLIDHNFSNAGAPATFSKHNSAVIAEFDAQLSPRWQSLGTALWNSEENIIREGSFSLRYRGEKKSSLMTPALANISYHFRGQNQQLALLQKNIEQADISIVTPITQSTGLIGRYQYDLQSHNSIESLAGLEYNNCCIKLRFVYRDGLIYNVDNPQDESRDRSFFLQVQLKGLAGIGESLENLLQESIFGY